MNYWIIVDNQPAGPYTGEQLVNAGLKPDTLVWRKGYAQWIESGRVPELADMMRSRDMAAASAAPEGAPAPAEPETNAEAGANAYASVEANSDAVSEAPAEESTCTVVEEDVTVVEESAPEEPAAATQMPASTEERSAASAAPEAPAFAAYQAPQQTAAPAPQTPGAENAAMQADVPPCPPAYVAWSIIVTILCCTPVGVAAIILSSMTKSAYYKGNLAKSKKYSEITQWLIIAAIVCGTALAPFQAVIMGML